MKVIYVSIESSDAHNMETPVREISMEKKWDVELFCINGECVDSDPLAYQDLVRKSKVADLILLRCMADPSRMKRFSEFENVLKEIGRASCRERV